MAVDYKTAYSQGKNVNTLDRGSYTDCGDGTPAKQVKVCSSAGDPVFVSPVDAASASPSILRAVNDSYGTANAIQSIALTDNTKYFELKHRDGGVIEFGFDAALTTFFTIPKGNSFSLAGLNTNSETIYYRSSKAGTIELIECSI